MSHTFTFTLEPFLDAPLLCRVHTCPGTCSVVILRVHTRIEIGYNHTYLYTHHTSYTGTGTNQGVKCAYPKTTREGEIFSSKKINQLPPFTIKSSTKKFLTQRNKLTHRPTPSVFIRCSSVLLVHTLI